jgi:hypothetical protein
MDSKLQLISKYGDGSDFYFIIKVKSRILKKKASTPSTQTPLGTTDAENILTDIKVLLVEDNKINMLLAKTLSKRIIINCTILKLRTVMKQLRFIARKARCDFDGHTDAKKMVMKLPMKSDSFKMQRIFL